MINKTEQHQDDQRRGRKGYFFDPGVFPGNWHAVECLSLSGHSALRVKIHLETKQLSVTEATSLQTKPVVWRLRRTYPTFGHIFVPPVSQHLGMNRRCNMTDAEAHGGQDVKQQ